MSSNVLVVLPPRAIALDLVNGLHRIPMHKIEFLQTNVSAKFKDGSCLEECVCQIDLGELDPSTHPNCAETHAGRSQRPLLDSRPRAISAKGCAHTGQRSPAFRALDTHDLRRGLRVDRTNRTLACISRTRHARSPQRVAPGWDKSHSRLQFRALNTHDLRRGLRAHRTPDKSHSRLHFAHSTRTISAEGCPRAGQIALSPAFRALDTHDLRRGLRAHRTNRTLACISRTRHARSPQRVARTPDQSHSRLHFAHSTRTISAEGYIFG